MGGAPLGDACYLPRPITMKLPPLHLPPPPSPCQSGVAQLSETLTCEEACKLHHRQRPGSQHMHWSYTNISAKDLRSGKTSTAHIAPLRAPPAPAGSEPRADGFPLLVTTLPPPRLPPPPDVCQSAVTFQGSCTSKKKQYTLIH